MEQFGLIGYPLKHSFSARFFAEKFTEENIDATYNNFEIPSLDNFKSIITDNADLVGLNVTIPYKENVIPLLDELDSMAEKIGAVNVIKISRKKGEIFLKGYNSDIIGFINSIKPLINPEIHEKALILGTGGAAKAVFYALESIGIECKYVSRKEKENQLTYFELNKDVMDEYKIIINASPIGTFPNVNECPNIPYKYVGKNHLLYDLVYNPSITKFLALGTENGAITKNGYEMLELQALAAWDIWNDL